MRHSEAFVTDTASTEQLFVPLASWSFELDSNRSTHRMVRDCHTRHQSKLFLVKVPRRIDSGWQSARHDITYGKMLIRYAIIVLNFQNKYNYQVVIVPCALGDAFPTTFRARRPFGPLSNSTFWRYLQNQIASLRKVFFLPFLNKVSRVTLSKHKITMCLQNALLSLLINIHILTMCFSFES